MKKGLERTKRGNFPPHFLSFEKPVPLRDTRFEEHDTTFAGDSFMRVAVKRLKSNYSTEEMENLIVEYNVIKTLDHPHVTKLLGAFTTPDEPLCIIMEFAKHGCLR